MAEASVTVRAATPEDAGDISRVRVETWRVAYADLLPAELLASLSIETGREWWRGMLSRPASPGRQTFVAERDGRVVGFASVGDWRDEPDPQVGELYAIYVEAGHWGAGFGRALIERAEEALRQAGFVEARLWVLEGNERTQRFYRAAGWEQDGRKQDVLEGTNVVELRYSKPL